MNTSAIQTGILRRTMAGALLAATIIATAVGLASTARADDDAPAPAIQVPVAVPAPLAPWLPPIRQFGGGYGRIHCGFPGWQGPFQCWY